MRKRNFAKEIQVNVMVINDFVDDVERLLAAFGIIRSKKRC